MPAQGPGPRAFVEVEPQATAVWLHEPLDLLLRVGYDVEFFAASALPLFQQRLDQPFQVVVPWLQGADDRAVELVAASPPAGGQRVAVGERVAVWQSAGQRQVDGRAFALLELHCRWLPLAAGVSTIAPVELRYAFATRFEDDFLRGRQPLDRQEASVLSPTLQLTVKALPSEGRPAGFAGAVGEFTGRAVSNQATVTQGATFALELRIEGAGNLERLPPLPWPELPGYHVQGLVERREATTRTFVFDVLALRVGLTEVPAVPFVAFSPRLGQYVTLRLGPVPMQVLPPAPGTVLPERVLGLLAADALADERAKAWPLWSYLLAALGLGGGGLWWWRQRRSAGRRHELAAAYAQLGPALGAGPESALAAFEALCAQCAGIVPFAADTVFAALSQPEVAASLLARVRLLHARLDAARYGGVPPTADEVLLVARELVAVGGRGSRVVTAPA